MRVILVKKKTLYTRFSENVEAQNIVKKKEFIQAKKDHEEYQQCVQNILETLEGSKIRPWIINTGQAFDSRGTDLVITVGGDGTLLSASHHVGPDIPMLAIKSNSSSVGFLCCPLQLSKKNKESNAIRGKAAILGVARRLVGQRQLSFRPISRMEVLVRGKSVSKRVLNEALFSHVCPAAMSRMMFENEYYESSGVWVGTGAGSTGAMSSAGGTQMNPDQPDLQAIIREPYNNREKKQFFKSEFKLVNRITEAVLYLDGPYLQVPVGFGDAVTFRTSKEPLVLAR